MVSLVVLMKLIVTPRTLHNFRFLNFQQLYAAMHLRHGHRVDNVKLFTLVQATGSNKITIKCKSVLNISTILVFKKTL